MTKDPYSVLGISRSASDADIKAAYRRLAKRYHPDHNGNDPRAKERFAEIGAAYEILGDPQRRAKFDRGEIDASGKERFTAGGFSPFGDDAAFQGGWRFHSRGGPGPGAAGGPGGVDDILREFMSGFSGFRGGPGPGPGGAAGPGREGPAGGAAEDVWADSQQRGRDIEVSVSVTLEDLVSDEKVRVSLPTGKTVDFRIPPGAVTGQQVRLRGQGYPSPTGSMPGDALVTLEVLQHPVYRREGADLWVDVPVTLYDAVLGGKVRAPTLDGPVQVSVPAGTSGGKTLRLRGKGLPKKTGTRGDLLVTLRTALPDPPDPDLVALMRRLKDERPYQPR